MTIVREIFWLATIFNFQIRAVHIPGKQNILADAISRLHSSHSFSTFHNYFDISASTVLQMYLKFHTHMSFKAFVAIYPQVVQWTMDWKNSTWRSLG